MSDLFDPSIFLEMSIDQAFSDRIPLPIEPIYTAQIETVTVTPYVSKKTNEEGRRAEVSLILDIPPEIQQELGYNATFKLTDSFTLDLNKSGTGLDATPGKNRALKDYREATDCNKAGVPFSMSQLQGKIVKVRLKHNLWEGRLLEKIAAVTSY